jgi:hypothetical protein
MEEEHRELLLRCLWEITSDLEPRDVFASLVASGVLSEDDREVIEQGVTRRDRSYSLVMTLMRKGPDAFQSLCDALLSTYPHLNALLTGNSVGGLSTHKLNEVVARELCFCFIKKVTHLAIFSPFNCKLFRGVRFLWLAVCCMNPASPLAISINHHSSNLSIYLCDGILIHVIKEQLQ